MHAQCILSMYIIKSAQLWMNQSIIAFIVKLFAVAQHWGYVYSHIYNYSDSIVLVQSHHSNILQELLRSFKNFLQMRVVHSGIQ